MQAQAEASLPTRKRLWKTLVKAKISAQADALDMVGHRSGALRDLARKVRSGDPDNIEGMAARRYWTQMMGDGFRRDRGAGGANALLNYGYMVLRAATARSILAAGLHPSLSIHHQSRGTALPWCTTPIEAESSLGPDSHHPIISLSGIPSAVIVLRILHPILASTLCAANPLARIAEPTIAL